ncbi:MAG TPA: lysylphosphatidylglycerol synthase transmembrane domain-containing protein [Solirubrobacteraceae bacterium]|nr:lysylphosphatidylglycerol synthase transmembrane domain-containing protein [Solirubrobacteraceae bacterium]
MLVRDQKADTARPVGQTGAAGAPPRPELAAGPQAPRRRLTSSQRRGLYLAMVALTVVFAYVALSNINLALAWKALRSTDYWWIGAALVAFGFGNLARALRWRSLFARGRRPPVGPVFDATMVGYLYNNIMPARVGEAARVVVLTQRSDTAPVEIVGTVVVERMYDVFAILLIFFAAEPWLAPVSWFSTAAVAAIVLALAIATAAIVLTIYGERPVRFLLKPLRRHPRFPAERVERLASELTHGLSGLRDWEVASEALLWTLAAWLLTALCSYLVAVAFHLDVPFWCGVLVSVAVGLSMIIPSPPAAVGVFEAAALVALKAYGVPYSEALPYALVLHLVNFVPFVVVGGLLLHYNARHPATRHVGTTDESN